MALRKAGRLPLLALFLPLLLLPSLGRSEGEEGGKDGDAAAEGTGETEDTNDKGILSQLTITLGSDVVDERSFIIRSTEAGSKKQLIRLGNVNHVEEGIPDYEEKKEKATKALKQFCEKQMVFWKAAPDEAQTKEEKDGMSVIIADVWTIDGRHVPQAMVKAGHLNSATHYESDIAKDILMADADEKKRDQYKKLEDALKENNEHQARQAAAEKEAAEEEAVEPLGVAGWMGLSVPAVIILWGLLSNFGRTEKKLSRGGPKKKGFFASILSKLKLS